MMVKMQNSPNFSKKSRKNADIKLIIIHYTGMQSRIASINRLKSKKAKVSCHYFIDRKGQTIGMVDEKKIAWHAGKSRWKNFTDLNKNSIGIELVNKGHEFGYEKFTNIQIKKLITLCLYLKKKYTIKNSNIIGHSDIAPTRKKDPGEKFPWEKLSKNKIGIWYNEKSVKRIFFVERKIENFFFKNLFKIGYRYFNLKKISKHKILLVKAFQRRFNPKYVTGRVDQKTYKISQYLANKCKN